MRPRWLLEEGMWSRARAPRLRWRLGFEEWGRRQRKPLRYAPTEARRPRILAGARARGARGDGGGEEVVVDVVAARASSGGAVDGGLQRRRRRRCGATRPALRRRHPRGRRAPAPWAEEARNSGSPRQVRVDASHPSAAPHVGRRAPAPAKDSNLLMVTRYTSSSRQQVSELFVSVVHRFLFECRITAAAMDKLSSCT